MRANPISAQMQRLSWVCIFAALICISVRADEFQDGLEAAGKAVGVSSEGIKKMVAMLDPFKPPKGMKVGKQMIVDGLKRMKAQWKEQAPGPDKSKVDAFMQEIEGFLIKEYGQ